MAAKESQGSPPAYKKAFLESCLSANVLTFGSFTLNSGRQSPYFFNAGSFHTGALLHAISTAYAETILSFLASDPSIPKPDVIFGPSYKGIPLACSTLLALHRLSPSTFTPVSYSFNRKERKSHGEGGDIVGASLKGKNILVIDDVVTAGTAMRETLQLVGREGGKVVGFVVAVDRQERMPGPKDGEGKEVESGDGSRRRSAMGMIRGEFGVKTASIATLDDVIAVVREKGEGEGKGEMGQYLGRLEEYRRRYRADDDNDEHDKDGEETKR